MKVVAIIQARMRSTRLPGKVMAEINGKPMLSHVVERAQRAQLQDLVVVATSVCPSDDKVASFCRDKDIPYFRGSLNDVLDRFYKAAIHFRADAIVRLTADCPLLDASVIDKVIRVFLTGNFDYVSNTIKPTYPDGLDTEIISLDALRKAWLRAGLGSEREHVTPYIWKNQTLFRLKNVINDEDHSCLRWTVDEPEDMEFMRLLFSYFHGKIPFEMVELLKLIREIPGLQKINAARQRNEGYMKSLRNDELSGLLSHDNRIKENPV